jgi:hypothetical protein
MGGQEHIRHAGDLRESASTKKKNRLLKTSVGLSTRGGCSAKSLRGFGINRGSQQYT